MWHLYPLFDSMRPEQTDVVQKLVGAGLLWADATAIKLKKIRSCIVI